MSDARAAEAFGRKHGYVAIVRYKAHGAPDFTHIGLCRMDAEIEGYLGSPYCTEPEIIYDGRSRAIRVTEERILAGSCAKCGWRTSRSSLTLMAGNDFYICPKCGLMVCEACYPRLPLTSSPGYGMCPECRVQVQRAVPGFYG
jgi:hypothetical protein